MARRQRRSRSGCREWSDVASAITLVVVSELDLGLEPVLERRQPQLVEAGDLALEERLEGEVGERRPAPERQGVRERRRALGRRQRRSVTDEALEALRVDCPGVDAKHVSRRAGLDRLPTERPPEAVDGVLHDGYRGRRRLAVPEVVEQRVHRDDRSRVERQVGEQGALPRTTQREPLTRGANLKWSEQEDFHLTASRVSPAARPYHRPRRPYRGAISESLAPSPRLLPATREGGT